MSSTVTLAKTEESVEHHGEESVEHHGDGSPEYREAELISFHNCSKGLGIKICGGCSRDGREVNGIFVKRILPGGLADIDGHLQQGDEILSVNDESFEGITNDRAVAILRQASASNHVEMAIARDEQSKAEFLEIIEKQNGVSKRCTPLPQDLHSTKPHMQQSNSINSLKSLVTNGLNEGEVSPRSNSQHSERNSPRYDAITDSQDYSPRPENLSEEDHIVPNGNARQDESNFQQHVFRPRHLVPSMASTPHSKGERGDQCMLSSQMDLSPVHGNTTSVDSFNSSGHSEQSLKSHHHTRKLSLDPAVRLKIQKLELALRYLGLQPSVEQEEQLRKQLHVDSSGTVNYGDFVAVVREMFREELKEKKIDPCAMLFAANDLTDIVEPPAFNSQIRTNPHISVNGLQQERDELYLEVQRLRMKLQESEAARCRAEEELYNISQKAQNETLSLRKKVQIAERAQKEARNTEKDYEEVVQLLEAEIAKLKEDKKSHVSDNSQQKMAIFSCQLKKLEAEKKTYEVATEKLLQFAENVHESMINQGVNTGMRRGETARGNQPPAYLGKHKQSNPRTIAKEAKEVVTAVRSIIEKDPLPYGWEETYTSDGMRYYINHVTQTTTWAHPKTGVQQISATQENGSKNPQTKSS